jgi:hypothetical protein
LYHALEILAFREFSTHVLVPEAPELVTIQVVDERPHQVWRRVLPGAHTVPPQLREHIVTIVKYRTFRLQRRP